MPVPKSAPTASTAGTAMTPGSRHFSKASASRTLTRPTTAPTDRSIPPERITKVSPMAAMPRKELSEKKLSRTRSEANPS
jgi:hypothetical protein